MQVSLIKPIDFENTMRWVQMHGNLQKRLITDDPLMAQHHHCEHEMYEHVLALLNTINPSRESDDNN